VNLKKLTLLKVDFSIYETRLDLSNNVKKWAVKPETKTVPVVL